MRCCPRQSLGNLVIFNGKRERSAPEQKKRRLSLSLKKSKDRFGNVSVSELDTDTFPKRSFDFLSDKDRRRFFCSGGSFSFTIENHRYQTFSTTVTLTSPCLPGH